MAQTKPSRKRSIGAAELGRSGRLLSYAVLPGGRALVLFHAHEIGKPERDGGQQTRRGHFAARRLRFCR